MDSVWVHMVRASRRSFRVVKGGIRDEKQGKSGRREISHRLLDDHRGESDLNESGNENV